MDIIRFKDSEDFEKNTIYFSGGFEAKLYRYIKDGKELMIKKYYRINNNFIEKIKAIDELECDGIIKPKYLVSIDKDTTSFAMDFKRGYYPIKVMKKDMSEFDKYNLLLKLKEIITTLKEQGCIYADLSERNIITNGNDVLLSDMLNVKIGSYNFDEYSSLMRNYKEKVGSFDGIENYMLNIFTIYLLNDIEYDEVFNTISSTLSLMFNKKEADFINGVSDNLDCMNICYDLLSCTVPCQELLLDYIDKEKYKNKLI